MSNQSGKHAAVLSIIGQSNLPFESAFHAMFDADGIATGPFNSRLLAWLNEYLETSHTALASAQHAFAVSLGFASWNSLNTWDALSSYDADAAAYIDATGELFPDALNTLVLGIKAAGLWDDHIGSIKKAIGVPSLAASMIDLRNTAFNGTAVNTPTHSATTGWGFTAASSQYIDSKWQCGATDSKATQDSVHIGLRVREFTSIALQFVAGGRMTTPNRQIALSFASLDPQYQLNDNLAEGPTITPSAPVHYVASRTASNVKNLYGDGVLADGNTTASVAIANANVAIGGRNTGGALALFFTGRISLFHAGTGLDATQIAALTALFDAYATACGET